MMRLLSILFFLIFATAEYADAQLRDDLASRSDYSGNIVQYQRPEPGNLSNLFNMKMSHSYTATFSSFGGQYQNINAYTNTMQFFFSEKLDGRLDVSFLHSPFGNSFQNNGLGSQILIQNAELNYQLNDKASIHFQFRQIPSYGYGAINNFGRFNRFGYNPWY